MTNSDHTFDYALVGGGLQNGLLALALAECQPQARVLLVEKEPRLGGNHTWSFHAADVEPRDLRYVERLVCFRWPTHTVEFPGLRRRLNRPYASITSDRLDRVVKELFSNRPGWELRLGTNVAEVSAHEVRLGDGCLLQAQLVVDARGPGPAGQGRVQAYQKFLGLELELERPLPVTEPVLMDATVPQVDGFRFFYLLPLSERRILVEDTYYSDSPQLDREQLRARVLAYAAERSMVAAAVVREEEGVLPLPLQRLEPASGESPLIGGYQGGWFHPTTGYSFPVALRLARFVAERSPQLLFQQGWARLVRRHRRQLRFGVLLNRLLFGAFRPEDRYHVFERFYRLPETVIDRFYSLSTTRLDRLRQFVGLPPRGFSFRLLLGSGKK